MEREAAIQLKCEKCYRSSTVRSLNREVCVSKNCIINSTFTKKSIRNFKEDINNGQILLSVSAMFKRSK